MILIIKYYFLRDGVHTFKTYILIREDCIYYIYNFNLIIAWLKFILHKFDPIKNNHAHRLRDRD